MKLSDYPTLKKEILALPVKERDKLLLRLIAKDKILTERFHYLLIEGESGLQNRVEEIQENLKDLLNSASPKQLTDAASLLQLCRLGMKWINHFNKVTKSKFDTLELKLYFLNLINLGEVNKKLSSQRIKLELLNKYLIKTTNSIHKSSTTLHPDLQFDLEAAGEKWVSHMHQHVPIAWIRNYGLIKAWQ